MCKIIQLASYLRDLARERIELCGCVSSVQAGHGPLEHVTFERDGAAVF